MSCLGNPVERLQLINPNLPGDICSPSVVFSMRSSFAFLPLSGACFETPEGEPLLVDFYDPHSYSDYNLSPVTKGLYREKGFAREEERREGMEEAAEVHGSGGVAGFGEGNLGETGRRSKGIEEALTGVRAEEVKTSTPQAREEIPQDEAEGEVDIEGLPDSRRSSANNDSAIQMDRQGSADSNSGVADRGRRPSSSSGEDEEPPLMPELDKVLSASDQTIATYLARTLKRVKQVSSFLPRILSELTPHFLSFTPTLRSCTTPSRPLLVSTLP